GQDTAQRLKEEEELGLRRPQGWQLWLVPAIALTWSLFQLSLASWLLLDTTYIRAIHLAFALLIVFLSYPTLRRDVRLPGLRWLGETHKIPLPDMLLALLAALAALYIVLDYAGIAGRVGRPSQLDLVVGIFLVLVLLEAARRVIGPALPVIAAAFTGYAFFGPYMPDFLAFKGVSLARYVSQISLTTEGIYGIPLGVSARIVFLFVLFGALLDKAGAGKFFIDLAMSLLGRYKGGPAKAAVLASGLTGMVSGSSIANVVTTGTFTIPLMKKVGYPAKKAAAIEVAVSTNGQLMPPIMGAAAFIIAEYVNVSYLEVVKAAAIPAFASYFALFFLTHLEASKLGMRGLTKAEMPQFFAILRGGFHFLVPILVLLYELIIPRHSPDLAAYRAILVLAAIMLVQHAVRALLFGGNALHGLRQGALDILNGLISGGRNMVAVAVATAAAGIIVGVVTLGLGGLITNIIDTLSRGNLFLMLLITALASLILGMGLPTTANYIVMASLTAPALVTIAGWQGFAVPLIAAHLFVFYFGILADDTPPVGLAAYAASAIARSDPIPTGLQAFMYDIRTAVLPFMFIFNTDMLLVGVEGYFLPVYIFAMTCIGAFAFVSATQGWFLIRTRWYEIVLLLGVALIMFRPGFFAHYVGIDNHYLSYLVGVALYAAIFALQKLRAAKRPAAAT
ncbi:TRAP transporter permease, partial [Geoalkalibacter sp.]|uniref:TRAP transporter permease n=1 Tax=Geoalkalibacter sp. TaxID=3041440 RepID=UPI00272DD498